MRRRRKTRLWSAEFGPWRTEGRTAGRARRKIYRLSGWTVDAAIVTLWHYENGRWVRYVERGPWPARGPKWVRASRDTMREP